MSTGVEFRAKGGTIPPFASVFFFAATMSDPRSPEYENDLDKTDSTVAAFERDDHTVLARLRSSLHAYPTLIPACVLLVSILVFGLIAPRFLSPGVL